MNQPPTTSPIETNDSTRWGPEQLTIRGGRLDDRLDALQALLDAWNLPRAETPLVLAEWVHDMQLLSAAAWSGHADRDKLHLLERLRIFGPGGDFELRRDEDRLNWRWIGPAGTPVPEPGELGGADFWDVPDRTGDAPDRTGFVRRRIEHLLWGKLDESRRVWVDDRMARTPLSYPIEPAAELAQRVALRGWQFIADGTAQFVWWEKLEGRPAR